MKKNLSILLIICLLATLIPTGVFAEEDELFEVKGETFSMSILEKTATYEKILLKNLNSGTEEFIETNFSNDKTTVCVSEEGTEKYTITNGTNFTSNDKSNDYSQEKEYVSSLSSKKGSISWGPWHTKVNKKTSKADLIGNVSFIASVLASFLGIGASLLVSIASYLIAHNITNVWMKIHVKERIGKNPACMETLKTVQFYKNSNYTGYIDTKTQRWIHYY
ncbi:MAG: hypothetical protein RR967_07445 [Anaerovoracaceae bacterium]